MLNAFSNPNTISVAETKQNQIPFFVDASPRGEALFVAQDPVESQEAPLTPQDNTSLQNQTYIS